MTRTDSPPVRIDRRRFLELAGGSLAFTRLVGCTSRPRDKIVPYVEQPRGLTPGRAQAFATSFVVDGSAVGLLVTSHEGRPTKIEGHPEHPASLGAANAVTQASILGLYDPDRAKHIRQGDRPASYRAFADHFEADPDGKDDGRERSGKGHHFLLEPTSSPLVDTLLRELRGALPEARVHFYSPFGPDARWSAARASFGKVVEARHELSEARVVLALDADFLGESRLVVRDASAFSEGRRVRSRGDRMNRLYVAETTLSVTGMNADHRLSLRPSDFFGMAAALLSEIARSMPAGGAPQSVLTRLARNGPADATTRRWVRGVARDLLLYAGRAPVIVGDTLPEPIHVIGHAMNELLANVGQSVSYTEPVHVDAGAPNHGLEGLFDALSRGEVQTLVMVDGNPVYSAPGALDLGRFIESVPRRAYVGAYENETAATCPWFVPLAHYLETWGDARADDGTVSFIQPLIAPLYGGKSVSEVLALFAGRGTVSAHSLLRQFWADNGLADDASWEAAIARGFLPGTARSPERVDLDWRAVERALERLPGGGATPLELSVYRDRKVDDGRFGNNVWLQELPDPVSKQSWGNAALMNPETARDLGVAAGDVVELHTTVGRLEVPALPIPGHARRAVTLAFGYGRNGAESSAQGVGASAARLLPADGVGFALPVAVRRTGGIAPIAVSQIESSTHGRRVALRMNLADYRSRPHNEREAEPALYLLGPTGKHQWAMSIDLTACTGCSACVIACQAENNVPVVGREWLRRGRGMHWIRIDRYFVSDEDGAHVALQPMLCQHCEKAPCEYVCPVGATTHSADGLNEMTYNRCVGTRFCSNNCPYKVRRFNFLNYNAGLLPVEKLGKNPDVTVRARGVMEKCTYCVQRIRKAEIEAISESRPFLPSDVVTACAETCPTRAIVFGSLTDPASPVRALREDPRTFAELEELGTRPRTTYLARLRNPNRDVEGETT